MGSNRRYADQIDRRMDARILERIAAEGELQTLTSTELQLDVLPLTVDPRPRRVKAWVRFGGSPVLVDAVMVRWTPRAAGIVFEVAGKPMRTWVWGSAVEEVRNDETPPEPAVKASPRG